MKAVCVGELRTCMNATARPRRLCISAAEVPLGRRIARGQDGAALPEQQHGGEVHDEVAAFREGDLQVARIAAVGACVCH